jgi:four helix bundle protein
MVKTYRDLQVWKSAMKVAVAACDIADAFSSNERFSLADQMRRSGISIPSNIAEGQARGSRTEFIRYLHIARGSLAELETQLLIAKQRKLVGEEMFNDIWSESQSTGKMLGALIRSLK